MLTVIWPSAIATRAEVWRVLDLSGLTNSVRQSRNYLKSGYVFLDGNPVSTLKDTVEIGKIVRLEIRFPNGVIKACNLILTRPTPYKPRLNQPDTRHHKS